MAVQDQMLLAPSSNGFLDAISQASSILTNTAGSVLTSGGTFLDKLTAYKIARSQNVAQPVYVPETVSNLTDSGKILKIVAGVGVAGGVALLLYVVFKK